MDLQAELDLSKGVVVEVSRLTERALNSSESRHNRAGMIVRQIGSIF